MRDMAAPGREDVAAGRLERLYARRFDDETFRDEMWQVLTRDYFQAYVSPTATVLEIAAGYCEFINNIRGGRRIAVDLNPAVRDHAGAGVEAYVADATDLRFLDPGSIDVVFVSNFFEHITREQILAVLSEARRLLRPQTGRLVILQPNVRFCARDYWMFFDHITPVDDRALVEAFALTGLEPETVVERFLPYTTKSRLPQSAALVRAYLRVPPLWRLLGQQSVLVARRLETSSGGTP